METTSNNQATNLQLSTSSYNDTTKKEMDPNRALAMTLLRTVIPVIVLMGTIGNALSFCVLLRRRMRSTPMYFYLTLLAVADTFVLYVSAFKVWIRTLTQFEVLHVSNVGCKLFMFVLLCSFYMSAWLVVLVTLDRFLVIWFPFRGYLLMRIRKARLTAAVLAVIVAVYNIHVFWTIGLHQYESALTCDADEDNFFMTHIFEYLKLISYCVVPFVIVLALNVGILVRINRVYTNAAMRRDGGNREPAAVYRHQTPLVPSTSTSSSTSRRHSPPNIQKLRQRRLTRMLLFISFAWLALTAPFTLHSFLPLPSSPSSSLPPSSSPATAPNFLASKLSVTTSSTFNRLMKSVDSTSYNREMSHMLSSLVNSDEIQSTTIRLFLSEDNTVTSSSVSSFTSSPSVTIEAARYLLIKTICFLLMYVNHAINFYVYCLTGKRFRKELAAMLNCYCEMLSCGGGSEETAAAAAGEGGDAVRQMEIHRRNGNIFQQHGGRLPPIQPQPSSTSSRTRSAGMRMKNINPMRKSSELNDERFS